jgi:hypothetical protein
MKTWVLAASLLAAAVAPQAFAADLDDGEPPPPSWKGPTWKDSDYGYPPKGYAPPPGYYDDDDGRPYSKKYSYEGTPYKKYDKYDDDDDGRPYSKKYSYEGPPYKKYDDDDDGRPYSKKYSDVPPYKGSCVRSEQVRDRLTSLGWRDFHAGQAVSPATVKLRARRPTGRLFELRLDRCSGVILEARPVELSPMRPYYSYKQPPEYGYKQRPWGPYGYGGPYGPPGYWGPYAGRPYGYGKQSPPGWDD